MVILVFDSRVSLAAVMGAGVEKETGATSSSSAPSSTAVDTRSWGGPPGVELTTPWMISLAEVREVVDLGKELLVLPWQLLLVPCCLTLLTRCLWSRAATLLLLLREGLVCMVTEWQEVLLTETTFYDTIRRMQLIWCFSTQNAVLWNKQLFL